MNLYFVGIPYRKWSNTNWQGQIVPVEVDYSRESGYEGWYAAYVYGKELGLFRKEDKEKLPLGCRVFATLRTVGNHVEGETVDKPVDWKFSGSQANEFLEKVFRKIDDEWGMISEMYKMEEVFPERFHEWMIRSGEKEEELGEDSIKSYLHFKEWLDDRAMERFSSDAPKTFLEDQYGGKEWEAYMLYCQSEDEAYFTELEMGRLGIDCDNIHAAGRQFPGAATVDEDDAVFDDEGEYLGNL